MFGFFSVQLFLNIFDFRYLNDTPQFSVFHMFSCYMYFHAAYENWFALLTVILCQYLFCIYLNREKGCSRTESTAPFWHFMLCCVLLLFPSNSK